MNQRRASVSQSQRAPAVPAERFPPETTEEYLLDALERLDASEMRADQLTHALVHSRTIGAAIGVLMAMQKVTEAEAFDHLREASMAQNRKLHVIAQEVVDRGSL
ncbi:ANTAR domain-containing protein [Terrabacter carboxydivorans]|uniref:ANTAR domain-containing protein n=1 Tax=Terrabacter carboxydivorans TaxID=619730 RepID=A0ABN3KMZ8_9MICO